MAILAFTQPKYLTPPYQNFGDRHNFRKCSVAFVFSYLITTGALGSCRYAILPVPIACDEAGARRDGSFLQRPASDIYMSVVMITLPPKLGIR